MDYTTTTKRDFRILYPLKSIPMPKIPKDPPKLLYRRTLGYSEEDLTKRKGMNKFMDDNLERHEKIAALKMEHYKSYDPLRKCYTDPSHVKNKL